MSMTRLYTGPDGQTHIEHIDPASRPDLTALRAVSDRIVIGVGRDASDVAMATSFGAPRLESMTVWADEKL